MSDMMSIAKMQKKYPYFTHCKIAALRNRLHRNTSRAIIRELQDMRFVTVYPYRPTLASRFVVNWSRVESYCARNSVRMLSNSDKTVARTKAAWDAERAAYHRDKLSRAREFADGVRTRRESSDARDKGPALTTDQRKSAIAKFAHLLPKKKQFTPMTKSEQDENIQKMKRQLEMMRKHGDGGR